jgi:hypothetical protein
MADGQKGAAPRVERNSAVGDIFCRVLAALDLPVAARGIVLRLRVEHIERYLAAGVGEEGDGASRRASERSTALH